MKKRTLNEIDADLKTIKREISGEQEPELFSLKDIMRAFFGALFLGFGFVFSKLLFEASMGLGWASIITIVISTILIISAEIYFIGYERVKEKGKRKFLQFWAKRFFAFYPIGIIVSYYLVAVFGLLGQVGSTENAIKLILAVSMPCSIGAAISDLLKKY